MKCNKRCLSKKNLKIRYFDISLMKLSGQKCDVQCNKLSYFPVFRRLFITEYFSSFKKSKLAKKLSHHQTISHQDGRSARTLEPGELITSITIRTVQCGKGPGTQKRPPQRPLLKVTRISLLRIRKMANLCRKTGK